MERNGLIKRIEEPTDWKIQMDFYEYVSNQEI